MLNNPAGERLPAKLPIFHNRQKSAQQRPMVCPFQRQQLGNSRQRETCGLAAIQNRGYDLWREVCKPQVLSDDLGVDVVRVSQFFDAAVSAHLEEMHPGMGAND